MVKKGSDGEKFIDFDVNMSCVAVCTQQTST